MNKPKLTKEEALALTKPFNLPEEVVILGIRGYYKKTMGNPVKNDRGIYDDALFIISPDFFGTYNANTDPSVYRPATAKKKGIATLQPGVYYFIQGEHHPGTPKAYPALRQASNVTVKRDGSDTLETDSPKERFWINIHKGGYNTTSSEGCQTILPDQWLSFLHSVYDQMDRHGVKKVPYVLIEM